MINSKRLKYPSPSFISLTTLIRFIRFILPLLVFDSLLHCSIWFSHCICFSPSPSTKVICVWVRVCNVRITIWKEKLRICFNLN